jgi:hypothetical protein
MWSLWRTSEGVRKLAVSLSSTEPRPVIGHITKNHDETWSIEGDETLRSFQDAEEAIRILIVESAMANAQAK